MKYQTFGQTQALTNIHNLQYCNKIHNIASKADDLYKKISKTGVRVRKSKNQKTNPLSRYQYYLQEAEKLNNAKQHLKKKTKGRIYYSSFYNKAAEEYKSRLKQAQGGESDKKSGNIKPLNQRNKDLLMNLSYTLNENKDAKLKLKLKYDNTAMTPSKKQQQKQEAMKRREDYWRSC